MPRSLFAALLLLSPACSSSGLGPTPGPLTVVATNATLRLENLSGQAAFYFIYERESAALINWAQCVDPSACPSVEPGGRAVVPYQAIGGYAPGSREAIVWWWHAERTFNGKPVPGEVHAVVVGL